MFVFIQKLLPKHLLSRVIGYLAACENRLIKTIFINLFCFLYDIDTKEAQRTKKSDYLSFNDFFTRSLKEGTRPIQGPISSPADGIVAELGHISEKTLIQSKKYKYSAQNLLAEATNEFNEGSFITIYLAPHNYHRVHAPCMAELYQACYVPGELFSVNIETAEMLPNLFTRNERLVCKFKTEHGPMAEILVGAMLVGAIKPVWQSSPYKPKFELTTELKHRFNPGEEIGQFQMGSTVILLFSKRLNFIVKQGDRVRVGQAIIS